VPGHSSPSTGVEGMDHGDFLSVPASAPAPIGGTSAGVLDGDQPYRQIHFKMVAVRHVAPMPIRRRVYTFGLPC